jgi:flagellar biosynthetic protein FlhB
MSEKTEKPTPDKLQKAKESGHVNKSTELSTCVMLFILLGFTQSIWPSTFETIKNTLGQLFYLNTRLAFNAQNIIHLLNLLAEKLLSLWLPFAIIALLAIIVSTIAQTGPVWTFHPLKPDFKRLQPTTGFKRLFSSKVGFDALKNILKLSLILIVVLISIWHEMPILLSLSKTTPQQLPSALMHLIMQWTLKLLGLFLCLAFMDKRYTQWKYTNDNRMSKHEVKEAYRLREGDPKIKQKRKQLHHQQRIKTTSLIHLKTAHVFITDARNLAIALTYDKTTMSAPRLVCKIQGDLLPKAKQLANQAQIPIIHNPKLAEKLYTTVGINQWIRREDYAAVALVFRDLSLNKTHALDNCPLLPAEED